MSLETRKILHNLGALTELGTEISSTHNFDEVIRASLYTLLGTLAITRGAISRFSEKPRQLKVIAARGMKDTAGRKIILGDDDVARLASHAHPILLAAEQNGLSQFVSRNRDLFNLMEAHMAIPMVVRGDLIGVIFLAGKFTREEFDAEDLEIINTISQHIGMAFHNHRLMVSLKRRADENRRMYRNMRQIYHDTVRAFGAAIDLKDAYTKGHSERVAKYSEAIAREMGITGSDLEYIGVAGFLHDIGKIVVDKAIINNPRPLTDREFAELNRHVTTGYEILSNIRDPWQEIAYMTKCHHEKVDGTGYPQGLKGEEIPLGSRIVTVADSFDAMMTDRPYRSRLALDKALEDLWRSSGKQFDGKIVAAFCRLLLKEIDGTTRERVLLPAIGIRFDHDKISEILNSMIEELS